MREIKFRGKTEGGGKWVFGYLIKNNDGKCYIKDTDYNVNNGRIDIIPELVALASVGEFTGLLDKNGREIYEGDLVVCYLSGARIGVVDTVLYNDESAAFEFKRRYTTIKAFLEHDGLYDTEIEVIGNVYENKELENA